MIRLIVPPLHRQMRSLERPGPFPSGCASGNLDGALELPSAPWRRHIAKLQEVPLAGQVWEWCPHSPRGGDGGPAKVPVFISPLCAQNGADIQISARETCLLFKKFDTVGVLLPESCLFYFLLSDL